MSTTQTLASLARRLNYKASPVGRTHVRQIGFACDYADLIRVAVDTDDTELWDKLSTIRSAALSDGVLTVEHASRAERAARLGVHFLSSAASTH